MERIILIAQQLVREGKVPNTALVKSRLPKNIPLPAIVAGLKVWASDPNREINVPTQLALTAAPNSENATSFDALFELKINQAIAPLSAEIESLKKQLNVLQEQLKQEEKN
ncbi:MAG: hypothetical protein V7782_14610 [Psychromonas sp.]